MDIAKKSTEAWLIISEILLGIILSLVFIKLIWNIDDFFGKDYLTGIIRFYGGLSLIFFFSVFSIGIIGAIKLKQSNKIIKAIFYSIFFWLFSLVISVVLINFLYFLSLYIILAGVVFGFNLGLRRSLQ